MTDDEASIISGDGGYLNGGGVEAALEDRDQPRLTISLHCSHLKRKGKKKKRGVCDQRKLICGAHCTKYTVQRRRDGRGSALVLEEDCNAGLVWRTMVLQVKEEMRDEVTEQGCETLELGRWALVDGKGMIWAMVNH